MNRTTQRAIKLLSNTASTGKYGEEKQDIAVINAIALADYFTDYVRRSSGIVCKKGCNHCCVAQRLKVTKSELRYIQRYMKDMRKLFIMSASDKACPMLDGTECAVYPVRPIMCRGGMSRDSSWCVSPPRRFVLRDESTPISFRSFLAAKSIQDALCHVLNEKPMPVNEAIGSI